MPKLDIRVSGKLKFSKWVDGDLDLTEENGSVSVTATVSKVQAPPAKPGKGKPTAPAPVETTTTAPPVEFTGGAVTEPTVEPSTDSGPQEFVGGVADLDGGVITDPDSGEVVATIDTDTGEVTTVGGDVVGTVDLGADLDAEGGVLDIVNGQGDVVGVVEVPEEG